MLKKMIVCLARRVRSRRRACPGRGRRRGPLLTLGLGLLLLGLAFGPAWTASKTGSKTKSKTASKAAAKAAQAASKKAAEEAAAAQPFAPGHSLLLLGGLRCQVHLEGVVRQDFVAETGRYDELAHVMDMERMRAKFMNGDPGTTVTAELKCGTGRIWTADRPKEGISTHDMLLQQTVHLRTGDNVQLQSPEMRYDAAATSLRTDKGFVEQIPAGTGYYIGKGQRFDIKLNFDENSFDSIKQYGTPGALTELRKNEKAVLNP